MATPLVSFAVVTRNRRDFCTRSVERCVAQDYPNKEIVVVDNGSEDGTAEALRARFGERIRLVPSKVNTGCAGGRNLAWRAAHGEYIVFLDDDCVLAEDGVADAVASQFAADPECGVIAFRVLDPLTGERPFRLTGVVGQEAAGESVRFCGGGAAIRREALDDLDGFYAPLVIGHTDTDFALRLLNAGWRIIVRNDIHVYHPSPEGEGPVNLKRAVYYNVRNSLWVAMRSLRFGQWFTLLLPKILHCLVLAYRTWSMRLFLAGLADGLRQAPRCFRERRPLRREISRRARRLGVKLWV